MAISFVVPFILLKHWPESPRALNPVATAASDTPEPPIVEPSPLNELPVVGEGLTWGGIAGLHAKVLSNEDRPLATQTPVRLTAIPTEGVHTVALQLTSLKPGQLYRVSAWVKSVSGGNVGLEVGDRAPNNPSHAVVFFGLDVDKILVNPNETKASLGAAGGWKRVWVYVSTSTGTLYLNLYVVKASTNTFMGDGKIGLVLAGFKAD